MISAGLVEQCYSLGSQPTLPASHKQAMLPNHIENLSAATANSNMHSSIISEPIHLPRLAPTLISPAAPRAPGPSLTPKPPSLTLRPSLPIGSWATSHSDQSIVTTPDCRTSKHTDVTFVIKLITCSHRQVTLRTSVTRTMLSIGYGRLVTGPGLRVSSSSVAIRHHWPVHFTACQR
ncbi:hypothetical protein NL676_029914 [Syzygium grande]|nr:hypothetical protein NL676_029914 [Syzygium grande]